MYQVVLSSWALFLGIAILGPVLHWLVYYMALHSYRETSRLEVLG